MALGCEIPAILRDDVAATHEELVAAAMAAPLDDVAFSEFYQTQLRRALQIARYRLGDAADAEDAVQEAFLRFYRRRDLAHISRVAYFYQILANCITDQGRLRQRRAAHESPDAPLPDDGLPTLAPALDRQDPADIVARLDLRDRVRRHLTLLDARDAATLLMYYEGFSDREIAYTLTATAPAIKQRRYRALRRFRAIVEGSVPDDGAVVGA